MKVAEVVLLDDTVSDLEIGQRFYEDRGEGLGDYFVDSLLSDIESLRLYAGIHPVRFGYHRLLSKRFPFAVYYEVVSEIVQVVAVLDMRRDPRSIRKSISARGQQDVGGNE